MSVQFGFDFDRALAAMVYIASRQVTRLDTYKLCKLIFLSDKLHLVRFGRPITGDVLCAMDYGPVPSSVYQLLREYLAEETTERVDILCQHLSIDRRFQYPRFELAQPVDFDYYLSPSEMNALDEVIAAHGTKTFDELYTLTHGMAAYRNAWDNPQRSTRNPAMNFEDLFENDSEAIAGTKEQMVEDYEMRQALHAV